MFVDIYVLLKYTSLLDRWLSAHNTSADDPKDIAGCKSGPRIGPFVTILIF